MDTPDRELGRCFQELDADKLIPYKKLTGLAEQHGPGVEEYLEFIFPKLIFFAQYVRTYFLGSEKVNEDDNGS